LRFFSEIIPGVISSWNALYLGCRSTAMMSAQAHALTARSGANPPRPTSVILFRQEIEMLHNQDEKLIGAVWTLSYQWNMEKIELTRIGPKWKATSKLGYTCYAVTGETIGHALMLLANEIEDDVSYSL
jgi:hypothetical protein